MNRRTALPPISSPSDLNSAWRLLITDLLDVAGASAIADSIDHVTTDDVDQLLRSCDMWEITSDRQNPSDPDARSWTVGIRLTDVLTINAALQTAVTLSRIVRAHAADAQMNAEGDRVWLTLAHHAPPLSPDDVTYSHRRAARHTNLPDPEQYDHPADAWNDMREALALLNAPALITESDPHTAEQLRAAAVMWQVSGRTPRSVSAWLHNYARLIERTNEPE